MKEINWMGWWNAAEYTSATLTDPNIYIRGTAPEWYEIHRGRGESSKRFMQEIRDKAMELHKMDAVVLSREEYNKLIGMANE